MLASQDAAPGPYHWNLTGDRVSIFDQLDARASRVFDRSLGEPLVWVPMLKRGGGQYTAPTYVLDPARGASDLLLATVTWAPTTEAVGPGADPARVSTFALSVEMDRAALEAGGHGLPRQFDRFELREEPRGTRWVEVQRIADEDSARVMFYCSVVRPV